MWVSKQPFYKCKNRLYINLKKKEMKLADLVDSSRFKNIANYENCSTRNSVVIKKGL